jgi:sigma-B regulation protein RsbU (phosphoserine phosphatase)
MIMNGSLAGLVGITASAHIMTPLSAMGIGCIAGAIMYGVTMLLEKLELDDVVGAVPVHLGAGIWGLLAVALFGDPDSWGTGLGRWEQLVVQATGVGATFVWAFGVGFTLLWLYNRRYPLRIDPEGERIGLNVAEHDASTEILDLLNDMDKQRRANEFSQPVNVEPHTEIGQIAQQYNRVIADINTEQRRREAVTEALRERTESLKLLRRVAAAANKARTVDEAMQTSLEDICEFGQWPVGHVYMLDEQGSGELVPTEIWRLEDPERFNPFKELTESTRFAPGVGLPGRVLASREPHWIADLADDTTGPRYSVARDVGIKGGLAVPVLVGSDVAAVLEFFSTEVIEPDGAILDFLASLGTQLGRVVERKRSEAARFKSVIDNMPAMVQLRDPDGRFILINRKYEEFYGVTNDFVRGKTLHEVDSQIQTSILAPDKNVIQDNDVLATGQVIEQESIHIRKGKGHVVVDVRFPVTELSGETVAVAGIELDITERKRAEEKLEEAYEIIRDQKERMESELNIGREIQMSMLPLVFPPFPDHAEFSIYAAVEPAREVGGDFYDFFFIDDEKFCVCIGDVSGKGVPSALFMAVTKTLIKSRATDDFSTASILTHVNTELSQNNKSCMFVTIFLGILNIRTGQLHYSNAGHNPPYVRRMDGSVQRLDSRHGPVIGAMEGMTYGEDATVLSLGDLLYLYTDGVTEEMNADDQLFSEERLADLLRSKGTNSVETAVRDTISAVHSFQGETEQSDDITVLALQFQADPASKPAALHMVIRNELSEIENVNASFEKFARDHNLPAVIGQKMGIAFDDLLNNVISYGFRDNGDHEVDIKAELVGSRLTITISDDGVPFNPLGIQTPDTGLSVDERELGGLGIHLVRNLVDDISYQRRINRNVLSVVMHTTPNDVMS